MATIVDFYSETNQDSGEPLVRPSDNVSRVGQSFTGDGQKLDSCKFYLHKVASPTGNITAELYAHTGTFGTTGKPTGSALATSTNSIAASSLSTSYALSTFTFDQTFTLVNGTKYVIVVRYEGGSGGNYIEAGKDDSSPTHAGNESYYDSSATWNAVSGSDVCFYVYGITPTVITSQNNSAKANIIKNNNTQSNSAKANLKTTYYTGATYDWKLSTADDNNKNRGFNS